LNICHQRSEPEPAPINPIVRKYYRGSSVFSRVFRPSACGGNQLPGSSPLPAGTTTPVHLPHTRSRRITAAMADQSSWWNGCHSAGPNSRGHISAERSLRLIQNAGVERPSGVGNCQHHLRADGSAQMALGNWIGAATIDHGQQPGLLRPKNQAQHSISFHCQLSIPANREALDQRASLRAAGREGQLGWAARRDRRKRVLIGISGIFQVAQERIVSPQPANFPTPSLPAGAALVLGLALDPDTLKPVKEFLPMGLECFEVGRVPLRGVNPEARMP
jgi:hypothetical protein